MSDQALPPIPLSALVALYGGEIATRDSAEVIDLPAPVQRPPQAEATGNGCTIIAFPAPQWQRNATRKER
ncbi:MAG: hypothetical protein ACOH2J_13145 [Allorhizobium sp.]